MRATLFMLTVSPNKIEENIAFSTKTSLKVINCDSDRQRSDYTFTFFNMMIFFLLNFIMNTEITKSWQKKM